MFLFKVDFEKSFDNLNRKFQTRWWRKWGSAWIGECGYGLVSPQLKTRSSSMGLRPKSLRRRKEYGKETRFPLFCLSLQPKGWMWLWREKKTLFRGVRLSNLGPKYLSNNTRSLNNARNLIRVLRCFQVASGLKVKLVKSSVVGIGVTNSEVSEMAPVLNCLEGSLPMKYLGVPLGAQMNRLSHGFRSSKNSNVN